MIFDQYGWNICKKTLMAPHAICFKVIIKTSRRSLNQQWLHTLHKFAEPVGLCRVTIPVIYLSWCFQIKAQDEEISKQKSTTASLEGKLNDLQRSLKALEVNYRIKEKKYAQLKWWVSGKKLKNRFIIN